MRKRSQQGDFLPESRSSQLMSVHQFEDVRRCSKMSQDVPRCFKQRPRVKTRSNHIKSIKIVNEKHHVSCCKLAFTGSLMIEPRTPGTVPGKRPCSCLRKRLLTCSADDLQVCGKSLLSFPSKLSKPNPVVPVVCRLDLAALGCRPGKQCEPARQGIGKSPRIATLLQKYGKFNVLARKR